MGDKLRAKFQGYWNYYGVIGNSRSLHNYWHHAQQLVFKWWNRRSQRRSYTWAGFNAMWQTLGLPLPGIMEGRYQPQRHLAL